MIRCYYKILGVSVRASQEEIKRAFRMLALRWHPDRNPQDPEATERFREVLEAYENLTDPQKKASYDKVRNARKPGSGKRRHVHSRVSENSASFDDLFNGYFGFHLDSSREIRRNDLRFDLQISAKEALRGTVEEIAFHRMVYCRKCMGNGRICISSSCTQCTGRGQVVECRVINVKIPPNSRQGTRMRLAGEGDQLDPRIAPADLIVVLNIVD